MEGCIVYENEKDYRQHCFGHCSDDSYSDVDCMVELGVG